MDDLLTNAARRSIGYLNGLETRGVAPSNEALARLDQLGGELPDAPSDAADVLAMLDEIGSPATVVNAAGRYFGFVNGGTLPAALAANWLAGAWDQNAGLSVSSPVAASLEEIVIAWLRDCLALPDGTGGGLVTGATMANVAGLAAARHAVLRRQGWDAERHGLFGAPSPTVIVGEEVHVALLKALSLLGFGSERVTRVPTDSQGRMRADSLPPLSETSIICLQAGNVNTGAFDPARPICEAARKAGAWVHVDGAFGLWAKAAPERMHLADGVELADSWALDGHKWLNVPYDCGIVLAREPAMLDAAMNASSAASYLVPEATGHPNRLTRKTRAGPAALRSGPRCARSGDQGSRNLSDVVAGMPRILPTVSGPPATRC